MKEIIYENCGNEIEWSSQLWTQFMQLRKKAEKNTGATHPENNGLHSVCSLHFVLSTNLYIKDQQDMSILIFLFKKYN